MAKVVKTRTITKADLIIAGCGVLLFLLVVGFNYVQSQQSEHGAYVNVINAKTGEVSSYSLSIPRTVEVQGSEGLTTIEISGGKAKIIDSPCPDKVCRDVFGWIGKEGQISVCLPNQIMLEVHENDEE